MSNEDDPPRKRHPALTWGMIIPMLVATIFVARVIRDEVAALLHPMFQDSPMSTIGSVLVSMVVVYIVHRCIKRLWPTEGRLLGAAKTCIAVIVAAFVMLGAAAITSAAWFALA